MSSWEILGEQRYWHLSGWKVDLFGSAYAMLQWACVGVGAILVTVNPAYKLHELVCSFAIFFSG